MSVICSATKTNGMAETGVVSGPTRHFIIVIPCGIHQNASVLLVTTDWAVE